MTAALDKSMLEGLLLGWELAKPRWLRPYTFLRLHQNPFEVYVRVSLQDLSTSESW